MVQSLSRLSLALNRNPGSSILFSPDDIAGLDLWMDADDAATVHIDGDGQVETWDDKSSNAHIATSSSGTSTTPKTVVVGDRTMIEFTRVNGNRFAIPDHASLNPGTNRFTVFCAYRKRGADHGTLINKGDDKPRYELFVNSDISSAGRLGIAFADTVDLIFASSTDHDFADGASRGAVMTRDAGGDYPHFELLAAGKAELELSPLEGTIVGDITTATSFFIGSRSTGIPTAHELEGDIGEILVYNAGLTDDEINTVNDYLSAKWSL